MIRFSIRQLLAVMALVALGLLAWRSRHDALNAALRAAQLKDEIQALEAQLHLTHPEMHAALLHAEDEFETLHATRTRAEEQFNQLQQKYTSLQPQEAGVLSIRSLPSLSLTGVPPPVAFRLAVPAERSVWLKFGVHSADDSMNASADWDERDLLTHSPFSASGPYQWRLPAGQHTLTVTHQQAVDGSLPIEITLDDERLLLTLYVREDVSGMRSSYISAPQQLDFPADCELPWLLTGDVNYADNGFAEPGRHRHGFTVWLSSQSSDFEPFPGLSSDRPSPAEGQ